MKAKKLEIPADKLLGILAPYVEGGFPEDAKVQVAHHIPGLTTTVILISSDSYPEVMGNDYLFYAAPLSLSENHQSKAGLEVIQGEKASKGDN